MAEETDPASTYMPPIKKLQGRDDWGTWHQSMIINATILGFWNVIDGKEEKPNDDTAAAAWKVKDLKATGFLINALSMKIRIKLEHEGFGLDERSSSQLLDLVHLTVLGTCQEDIFNTIVDFNRINRQNFTSLDAYVTRLLHNWTRIKAEYPNVPDMWFISNALFGLKESNETWYEEWTTCLRCGDDIDKDKLVKFLMSQAHEETWSQRNKGSLC